MANAIQERAEHASIYEALAKVHESPCISMYIAGNLPAGGEFKRLKEAARNAGGAYGDVLEWDKKAEKLMEANRRLIDEAELATRSGKTGVIFLSGDFSGYYPLQASVARRLMVGTEFYIRPLLPWIPIKDRFFVLALSQKHVRLFEGSSHGLEQKHLQATPESLHEDLAGVSFERNYEMHTAASPRANQKGAIFHGPGHGSKERLIHFFRDVDRGVTDVLKGEEAPLIVASVEYLFPIYQEANTYAHLAGEVIAGNPDLVAPGALHEASWKILRKHSADSAERALTVYREHVNTPLTSGNLREIVVAADRGAVRLLFVPAVGERWGALERPATVHMHETRKPGDEELLNLATILTLRHRGHVYGVASSDLPQGVEIAAVFRF